MAIHNNFSSLAKRLGQLGNNVVRNAEIIVKKATIAAYSTLVVVTPVDTGRARAGWIVSYNAPLDSDVGSANARGRVPLATYRARALATIAAWNLASGSLFISNSVEYIEYLEDGSSEQRPEGMTVHGKEAAIRVLKKAKFLRD